MQLRGIWLIAAVAFALLAAACAGGASAGGDSPATLDITTPADGAEVGSPFTVEVASNVALGDPSTGNNRVEADHGRLKSRLWPMRGLKQDRNAKVIVVGHAFVQNVRRGHYELASGEPATRRLVVAFDELALAI